MHERRTPTLLHTLDQPEKPSQNTMLAAQWIETIKIINTLGDRPIPAAKKNHQTSQDFIDGNDREDTMPLHERRTFTPPHNLDQSEKPTQKPYCLHNGLTRERLRKYV